MEHSIFIITAYGTAAVILAWCALAPVLRMRRLRARLAGAPPRTRIEDGR